MGITCRLHVLVVALCVAAVVVKGAKNCEEALDECHVCQERATETYKGDYVPPTAHLGNKWLDIEARRNCRWLTRVNTCIDKMVEVCPDNLKPLTRSVMNFLNKWEGLGQGHDEGFEDWDSKKCPGAIALKAKQDLVKLQQQKECNAEAEKVSVCNQQAKERREKLLEVGADSPDGRANFAKRVLCNWIREDYDQCIKPFVHCGFHQGDLLTIEVIQSNSPKWGPEHCPARSQDTAENKSNIMEQSSFLGILLMAIIALSV